jgi:hypothetical protein
MAKDGQFDDDVAYRKIRINFADAIPYVRLDVR